MCVLFRALGYSSVIGGAAMMTERKTCSTKFILPACLQVLVPTHHPPFLNFFEGKSLFGSTVLGFSGPRKFHLPASSLMEFVNHDLLCLCSLLRGGRWRKYRSSKSCFSFKSGSFNVHFPERWKMNLVG